jgi:hypothetical protein
MSAIAKRLTNVGGETPPLALQSALPVSLRNHKATAPSPPLAQRALASVTSTMGTVRSLVSHVT